MPSLLDRLLGRDKKKEEKATQRVSEEAARKRREELAQKKKDMEEARVRAEKAEERRLAASKEKEKAAAEAPTMAALKEKEKTGATARTYVVQSGDSLSKIAKELLGDAKRWPELYEANKELIGDDPNLIQPGQELTLP